MPRQPNNGGWQRATARGRTIAILASLCFLMQGCVEDGRVDVFLIKSSDLSKEPLAEGLTTHVRLRVSGPGMHPMEAVTEYRPGGALDVPDIPQGPRRVILVEGLRGEDSYAISRGRSLPVDIDGGKQTVRIFIARVGRFSLTPNNGLSHPLFGQTVVPRDDGLVWVLGGARGGSLASPSRAEQKPQILDPTDMSVRILECSACALPPRVGGAVAPMAEGYLLFGGRDAEGLSSTAHFVDASREVARVHALSFLKRENASSIVFDDVTVVAGGLSADGEPLSDIEIISREGDLRLAELPAARVGMAAGRAGRLGVFFGGFSEDGRPVGDAYLYDPERRTVSALENASAPRAYATAVSLPDGRLLLMGGLRADGRASDQVDLFDPEVGAMCPVGRLAVARWHLAATPLPSGRVLVVGGLTGGFPGQPTGETRILDPRYLKITPDCSEVDREALQKEGVEQTRTPRYLSTAVLTKNGNVAVVGGFDGAHRPIQSVEVYVPSESD